MSAPRDAWARAYHAPPGQWVGTRVLRRVDANGTRWCIRKFNDYGWYTLTCTYRDIRLVSQHNSVAAARRHCTDLIRSWEATSLRAYQRGTA